MMEKLAAALAGVPLPAAIVDLDAFDANVDRFATAARAAGKKLRVATKSIRCPDLVARVRERAGDVVRGLMTYTATETAYLAAAGWRDLLLAYPTVQAADAAALAAANAAGASAAVVVDDEAQLAPLAAAARAAATAIPVVVELDMSFRPLGGALHLGVRRSPLHDAAAAEALAARAATTEGLRFDGVMGYEAQLAGMPDSSAAVRAFKRVSTAPVFARRAELVRRLRERGLAPRIVNGGGTGDVAAAAADPALDEITVGSGFLAGHLFDGYDGLALAPALAFGLQVVRRPAPGIVTCHGGGFIASGGAGPDRLPRPVWPPGCALLPREGAGEVQTPVRLPPGVEVPLGGLVLFRHAKSGELAEHFEEYLLARGGRVEGRAKTYRGLGKVFLG
jgi:D-serine deaminase-like pyridoxal phosphate-dependent protein